MLHYFSSFTTKKGKNFLSGNCANKCFELRYKEICHKHKCLIIKKVIIKI